MAKLLTETITITLSKMIRNDEKSTTVLDEETLAGLVSVVTELAGDGVMVEVE
jgi:hypothetical protein